MSRATGCYWRLEVFGAPGAQKSRHAEVVKHQTLIVWPSKSKPSTGLTSEIIHQWLCLVFLFQATDSYHELAPIQRLEVFI